MSLSVIRVCENCHAPKPVAEFAGDRGTICKACRRAIRRKQNPPDADSRRGLMLSAHRDAITLSDVSESISRRMDGADGIAKMLVRGWRKARGAKAGGIVEFYWAKLLVEVVGKGALSNEEIDKMDDEELRNAMRDELLVYLDDPDFLEEAVSRHGKRLVDADHIVEAGEAEEAPESEG